MSDAEALLGKLQDAIRPLDRVAVAFSGGVDSSTLLAAAASALPGRVTAVIAESAAHPVSDREAASTVLEWLDVPHWKINVDPLALAQVRANAHDRCYHCKHALFSRMLELTRLENLGVLCDATNADDLELHRPGRKALKELGVKSPLAEQGLTKDDVRAVARLLELPVAERPSAACLITRIPYDQTVTAERLQRIDRGESLLRGLGFGQLRLRDHGTVARVEVPVADLGRALEQREAIARGLRAEGWQHVSLDLEGFRSGSYDTISNSGAST